MYGIDNERILEEYQDNSEGDVDRRAYERLGSHTQGTIEDSTYMFNLFELVVFL